MPKEHEGRTHGDGHIWKDSFDSPLNKPDQAVYQDLLTRILKNSGFELTFKSDDPELPQTLLALKQRMEIGFSNGCPFPEKAINEFLSEQETPPTSLKEIAEMFRKSSIFDGNHNMLFQLLLEKASDSLKNELRSFHSPWSLLKDQEDRNLPSDITDLDGRGVYGLAFDPLYFNSIVPLMKYIQNDCSDPDSKYENRFWKVFDFFEKTAGSIDSIDKLVAKTEKFLKEEQRVS